MPPHRVIGEYSRVKVPNVVVNSRAVTKGLPANAGVRRLALQTPDHTLEFGNFEGEIDAGERGARRIRITDTGTYDLHSWSDEETVFTLSGKRFKGTYCLVRLRRKGDRKWLLHRPPGFDLRSDSVAFCEPAAWHWTTRFMLAWIIPESDRRVFPRASPSQKPNLA